MYLECISGGERTIAMVVVNQTILVSFKSLASLIVCSTKITFLIYLKGGQTFSFVYAANESA